MSTEASVIWWRNEWTDSFSLSPSSVWKHTEAPENFSMKMSPFCLQNFSIARIQNRKWFPRPFVSLVIPLGEFNTPSWLQFPKQTPHVSQKINKRQVAHRVNFNEQNKTTPQWSELGRRKTSNEKISVFTLPTEPYIPATESINLTSIFTSTAITSSTQNKECGCKFQN